MPRGPAGARLQRPCSNLRNKARDWDRARRYADYDHAVVAWRSTLRPIREWSRARPWRAETRHVLFANVSRRQKRPHELLRRGEAVHLGERTREHLDGTIAWLCRAQDAAPGGGVAAGYALGRGWRAPYPETTGYIIPSFFDYAVRSGDVMYRDRALRMADWLETTQMPSGAFPSGLLGPNPSESVFNSGQILFGLLRAYRETENPRYIERARMAADWLVGVQDADGAWRRFAYFGIPHAYYTRVAWALIDLAEVAERDEYRDSGVRQIRWALDQRHSNGWFDINSCDGYLAGKVDAMWRATASYSCLTGSAQLAGLLLSLPRRDAHPDYVTTALNLNAQIKETQELHSSYPGVRGGIAGSDPIWGAYVPYWYLNWAAKFFLDALLLEDEVDERPSSERPK